MLFEIKDPLPRGPAACAGGYPRGPTRPLPFRKKEQRSWKGDHKNTRDVLRFLAFWEESPRSPGYGTGSLRPVDVIAEPLNTHTNIIMINMPNLNLLYSSDGNGMMCFFVCSFLAKAERAR